MFNFFREIFIVGYNDGLQGEKQFSTLTEAEIFAKDQTSICPNMTIRNKKGQLIATYN
jgi:hypothetical protein